MIKSIHGIFFGNYFYGLCAVALSIESGLQLKVGLNDALFYVLIFLSTIVYYTKAYLRSEDDSHQNNLRSLWYSQNKKAIKITQYLFLTGIFFIMCAILMTHKKAIVSFNFAEIALLILFPLLGLLYYGLESKQQSKFQFRQIGWLKPFCIGFCWAGVVSIYPIQYANMASSQHFHPTVFGILLFIKNFMFISVLSIMFDIKDYANDYNSHLKTFVVKFGLRKTIFYILIPLTSLGFASFIAFAISQHFSVGKIGLNLIPFLLILIVSFSLQKRQSISFYLIIIDGLMLVKGFCGSMAMVFF